MKSEYGQREVAVPVDKIPFDILQRHHHMFFHGIAGNAQLPCGLIVTLCLPGGTAQTPFAAWKAVR